MKWRPHLPNACPPDDAKPTSGIVYRIVETLDVNEKDFLSYREMYPDREYDLPECIVGGVSVYTERDGIEIAYSRIPAKRKKKHKKKIAVANLKPEYGKFKNTPSHTHKSHHTWWIPLGVEPWLEFDIVNLVSSSEDGDL